MLFDLDDTLYNRETSFRAWAASFAASTLRVEASAIAALVDRLVVLDNGGYTKRTALFDGIYAEFPHLDDDADHFIEAFYQEFLPLLTLDGGVPETLDYLDHRNVPFGIVTNGSVKQYEKLIQLRLHDRIACSLVSDTVQFRKPEAAIFQAALDAMNLRGEQILFVGDHPINDVKGAAALGMQTAWMSRGRTWTETDYTPTYVLNEPDDLLRIVHILIPPYNN